MLKVAGPAGEPTMTPASWTVLDPASFPESPYPGTRPSGSWRLRSDGLLTGLSPDRGAWRDRHTGERVVLSGRLILTYGSNLNPQKLLRRVLGHTGGEVYAVAAEVHDWTSAWCARRRMAGDCVTTLVPSPGSVENQLVLAATEDQRAVLDEVEGHGRGFFERRPHEGVVILEDGSRPDLEVYIGGPRRPALVRDGQYLLVAETSYEAIDSLLSSVSHVFVYGTLQPGEARWPLLAPYIDHARPLTRSGVPGALFDTHRGWPAAVFGRGSGRTVPGVVVRLRADGIATALAALDDIEGTASGLFRPVLVTAGGQDCWAYHWHGDIEGFTPIEAWPK